MQALRGEGLQVDDWNRERTRVLTVTGKGSKTVVAIGDRTVDALAKNRRARRAHRSTGSPQLWLGRNGPLTTSGIADPAQEGRGRRDRRAFTRTSSATHSPTSGSPPAARNRTS